MELVDSMAAGYFKTRLPWVLNLLALKVEEAIGLMFTLAIPSILILTVSFSSRSKATIRLSCCRAWLARGFLILIFILN